MLVDVVYVLELELENDSKDVINLVVGKKLKIYVGVCYQILVQWTS